MRLLDVGDRALLVELDDLPAVVALTAALDSARGVAGAPLLEDVVPGERTLLLRFDPRLAHPDDVRAWVRRAARLSPGPTASGELVEVGVRYDGADLDDVGELTRLGRRGVVEAHTATEWTVAFTGFAPGFGYLVGGDPRLEVPRLATPRTRVPAGAVALAGRYSGVYPRSSPGGWRLVGTTDAVLWDVAARPPALLRPGVRVRFREVRR